MGGENAVLTQPICNIIYQRSEFNVYTHYVGARFTCIYRRLKYYVVLQGCYKRNNSLYYGIQSSHFG